LAVPLTEAAFRPREAIAVGLLSMFDEDFRIAFKGAPMKRATLPGLKRNAAVVPGNLASAGDVPARRGVEGSRRRGTNQ
jgi:hypothetical protein